ncbi:MAG: VOC family protein [Rubrivivax sp.]|nr:VOC family protein [Rubrivivax sp.]
MDAFKTHGAFSWSELMTHDPKAAADFYGALFGWTVDTMDMGQGPYHVLKVGDSAVGGIMGMQPGGTGQPPAWGCYVTVDDIDKICETCKSLGGTVCMPPTAVQGVGRMALLKDPQGAVIHAITYSMG